MDLSEYETGEVHFKALDITVRLDDDQLYKHDGVTDNLIKYYIDTSLAFGKKDAKNIALTQLIKAFEKELGIKKSEWDVIARQIYHSSGFTYEAKRYDIEPKGVCVYTQYHMSPEKSYLITRTKIATWTKLGMLFARGHEETHALYGFDKLSYLQKDMASRVSLDLSDESLSFAQNYEESIAHIGGAWALYKRNKHKVFAAQLKSNTKKEYIEALDVLLDHVKS